MPFTREERQLIEDLVNRLLKAEDKIAILQQEVATLASMVNILDSADSGQQITDIIEEYISKKTIKKHDHKSDAQGGSAFAKLGANLISN